MDSMAVLLEAAAEDIKLIDCLGPEDLCYDPNSADGLKPVRLLQWCSAIYHRSALYSCCCPVCSMPASVPITYITEVRCILQLNAHSLRPRSTRAAATAAVAAAVQSVMDSPPTVNRHKPSPAKPRVAAKEQVAVTHTVLRPCFLAGRLSDEHQCA